MVDHARRNSPVVTHAIGRAVEHPKRLVVEWQRQTGRAGWSGTGSVVAAVIQKSHVMCISEILIDFHAAFVGWADRVSAVRDVVIGYISDRTRDNTGTIRSHGHGIAARGRS